ncbi:GAD-like domain-containing protein [Acidiphilium acidophilum]|uniref:GAD-like domain-containing protein n=1 Tax=Acidiphilium acidophilum TaxID=76588 RepID=UPI002E8E77EA|nr:GAD-like domain-containing protein [Acidiphilium acidophilum]
MTNINANFEYCIKKFGPPQDGETVPTEIRETHRGKVPQSLLDFWDVYGTGLWLDGKFQLVRPDRYQSLVDMLFEGDPDFPPGQSVLIGYTAFGTLMIWNDKNYFLRTDLVDKVAFTRHVSPKHPMLDGDRNLPTTLSNIDGDGYDYIEHTDAAKPLFARAMKKCGKLAYGECYGFVPAVGLGGRGVLDEVKKVRAAEHFAIIGQLEPIQLRYMDTEKRKIVVLREIGAPQSVALPSE